MEGSDAELLAAGSDVLGSQHGGVGGGLVTVGLDLHATSDTADGLTATGITQNVSHLEPPVLLGTLFQSVVRRASFVGTSESSPALGRRATDFFLCGRDLREIGDVDEGVIEGGEDAGNTEDELTCSRGTMSVFTLFAIMTPRCPQALEQWKVHDLPSRTWGPREMFSWAGRVVFLGGIVTAVLANCFGGG